MDRRTRRAQARRRAAIARWADAPTIADRLRLVHRCGCGCWTTDDPAAPAPHRCALYRPSS